MPELPDLQVFSKNLDRYFKGKKLLSLKVVRAKNPADSAAVLKNTLQGARLKSVYRSGKELRFEFDKKRLLGMHLMLHGELKLFEDRNAHPHTIAEFHFQGGRGLALTDWQGKANIKLNPTDKKGLDALSPELNTRRLAELLQTKSMVKAVLMNQELVRGIGNAYADEILWKAGISPFSKSNKIPAPRIRALARAIKTVLRQAEKQILKKQPDLLSGELRDFMQIHHPRKKQSPTGAPILQKTTGGRKTYYTREQETFA